MSIGPVQSYSPVINDAPATAQPDPPPRPQVRPHVETPPLTFPPNAGQSPEQQAPVKKAPAPESSLPEDEVQLQRDSDFENQLIVRYVDKTGNLILQVPAQQVLDLERTIAAEFQTKSPDTTNQPSQKDASHGH